MSRIVPPLFAGLALLVACSSQPAAAPSYTDRETQIGLQVRRELQQRGEIEAASPHYAALRRIAARMAPLAGKLYGRPFRFHIVREKVPNAFAVPGGDVYVTEPMFSFAHSQEELGGVLCHEVSHDIHHDVVNNMQKDRAVVAGASVLAALFGHGRDRIVNIVIGAAAAETELHFSRTVETNADLTGSDVCAQSGINPYGMIWLFQRFAADAELRRPPEFLSDHPNDGHRIRNLLRHFRRHPELFARYSSDSKNATPLK